MSNQQETGNNFPPLQKRIILYLAQNQPQTIHATKQGLSGHYKSVYVAFGVLQNKGLIRVVGTKTRRNRDFDLFWLTDPSICLALYEGTDPRILLKRTREVYPERTDLQFLIEAVPILGKDTLNSLFTITLKKGAIEQEQLTSLIARQMHHKFTPEQVKKFLAVAKKYPQADRELGNQLNDINQNIKEIQNLRKRLASTQ